LKSGRTLALDSLRGISILAMMFSGVIPWDGLPVWMYHAQEPPPSHKYDPTLAGITWVDLVFPFFLFALGAAIPLALKKRIERGTPMWQLVLGAFGRGLSLVAFAIYDQHVRPYSLASNPTTVTWQLALLGFAIAIPIWAALPREWPIWAKGLIRGIGVAAAIAFLSKATYPDGSGFSKDRNDIILLVLAWMATFGTIAWLATRTSITARLAVIAGLMAWRIGATVEGSEAAQWFWWDPMPWLGRPEFLHYLLIVLPGTIVGELLIGTKAPEGDTGEPITWHAWRNYALLAVTIAAIPISLVTLHGRYSLLWLIPIYSALLLVHRPNSDEDRQVAQIARYSVFWITIGTLLEPFEGGIKKDPVTLSYCFLAAGLAGLLLAGILAVSRRWKWVPFATVGQNPMFAYLAITNLIAPLWGLILTPAMSAAVAGTSAGVWVAIGKTVALATFTALAVRFRLSLKS
jgi:predicted acyltransferase